MNTKQARVSLTACSKNAVSALLLAAALAPAQENVWVSHGPTDAAGNAVSIGALALDPQNPSTIWAGGTGYPSGPGLFRSTDTGLSWSPAAGLPGSGDVKALAIDPENPRTMYARAYGIHWTEDGGETWTPSLSNSLVGYFFALDPADHRRIWTGSDAGIHGGGSGLHYSDDGARTFRSVPSVTQTIYSILFDQRRPGSIHGGSYDRVIEFGYPQAVGGSIFVSRDNGSTFTKGATNFGSRVKSMAADRFEDILYAATDSRGVFRSLDGGTTWEAAGAGGTPFDHLLKIIADPVRPGRLYASTTNGVFRSTDFARTWEHIGLTHASGEIVITPDGRWLYAGTSGGVFQLDLEASSECTFAVDRHANPSNANPNGVLENGEVATVEPSFLNGGSSTIAMAGTATSFTGPGAGATYSISDAAADYGTVPAGERQSCFDATGDCFAVSAYAPARPALHWDATLQETLSDTTLRSWPIHIGRSFSDVPSSHNEYRYVETLLHHGITSGCGGSSFRPDENVTRAQMAVFLLRAKHGSAYVPPPASGQIFVDVPADAFAAAWIERLAAEEITAGCGSGNFCPDSPATRAQTAMLVLKTKHGAAWVPPPANGDFTDVPVGDPFAPWIEAFYDEGVTAGCGVNIYCPAASTKRGQMAVVLTKAFGLALYGR